MGSRLAYTAELCLNFFWHPDRVLTKQKGLCSAVFHQHKLENAMMSFIKRASVKCDGFGYLLRTGARTERFSGILNSK